MAVEVIMPKAGSEMEEGEIVQWFKQEGDEVKEGEILLEIVTDKVNMEVEAEASGTLLKIVHPAGSVVPVVQTIAWIGQPGEAVPGAGAAPAAATAPVEEAVVETEDIEENDGPVKKAKREDYIVKNQDRIVSYLQNIVIAMGYPDATVDFREDGNRHFTLNIKTEENTSLIIGKRGITLNSLQFLVNNYAKKFSSHYFRIEVDCDDYRENRKKTLEELALNLAKKSKKIGKPVELEPMTSIERKIIHNALTGIKNVETESRGEEPHRYLVITAK